LPYPPSLDYQTPPLECFTQFEAIALKDTGERAAEAEASLPELEVAWRE